MEPPRNLVIETRSAIFKDKPPGPARPSRSKRISTPSNTNMAVVWSFNPQERPVSRRMSGDRGRKFWMHGICLEGTNCGKNSGEIRKRKMEREEEVEEFKVRVKRKPKKDLTQRARRSEHGVHREERNEDGKGKWKSENGRSEESGE